MKYKERFIKDLTIKLRHRDLCKITGGSYTYEQSCEFFNNLSKDTKTKLYNETVKILSNINDIDYIFEYSLKQLCDCVGMNPDKFDDFFKKMHKEDCISMQTFILEYIDKNKRSMYK